ncbi:hypothetical protein SVAN01_10365 [Stagonosporopsis vannaccii]|nr:hypothetical protein SVAN01_10365 [Stagonosporopsis vannaccii]
MSLTSPILTFATRGTQALFAVVVFGLSTTLIKGHKVGSLPSTLGFVAFVGGISFVAALLGVASHWIQVLQGKVGVLMDAVIAGLNVAGGILLAIKLKGVQCADNDCNETWDEWDNCAKLISSDILCGGISKQDDIEYCYWWKDNLKMVASRCKMSQADSVFMFLTARAGCWSRAIRLRRR